MSVSPAPKEFLAHLDDETREHIDDIRELTSVESTNTWLQMQAPPLPGRCTAVIADEQTAGRGQRGKTWVSSREAGLYLSLAFTFERQPNALAATALVTGIAVLDALRGIGAERLALKWPNDIFANDAKLGGILVDTTSSPKEHVCVICGIGVNIDLSALPAEQRAGFDNPATDLRSACRRLPERAAVVNAIFATLVPALRRFDADGLAAFRDSWEKTDWLYGKAIDVRSAGEVITGTATGIDDKGALQVATETGVRRVYSGTVRLKAAGA